MYTPTLYTKLSAVALKHQAWYPHFMWMVKKKGYEVEYATEPAPEAAGEEEMEARRSGADIEKEVAIKANEIVAEEIAKMDDIDATELGEEWEDFVNKKNNTRGTCLCAMRTSHSGRLKRRSTLRWR